MGTSLFGVGGKCGFSPLLFPRLTLALPSNLAAQLLHFMSHLLHLRAQLLQLLAEFVVGFAVPIYRPPALELCAHLFGGLFQVSGLFRQTCRVQMLDRFVNVPDPVRPVRRPFFPFLALASFQCGGELMLEALGILVTAGLA